jgi:hypothetical protein
MAAALARTFALWRTVLFWKVLPVLLKSRNIGG